MFFSMESDTASLLPPLNYFTRWRNIKCLLLGEYAAPALLPRCGKGAITNDELIEEITVIKEASSCFSLSGPLPIQLVV
jgi:hypothetical protein